MKQTYSGLDVLKVLAAIGIVAIHTGATGLNTIGRLGVPFFAIVSSMLFFKKYQILADIERKHYLRHFLKRLGILFLCWQVFYLPSAALYLVQDVHKRGTAVGTLHFLRHFIFPPLPLTNGWGQSWYLIGMLIALPLFLVLLKFLGKWVVAVLCVLLYLFYVDYNTGYRFWNGIKYLPHSLVYFLGPIGNNSFPILLTYVGIGMLIASYLPRLVARPAHMFIWLVGVGLILYLVENILLWSLTGKIDNMTVLLTAPTSALLVLAGIKWPLNLQRDMFWRRFCTFLYCIHVGIIHCFDILKIILHVQLNAYLVMLLTLILSFIVYLLFNYLLERRHWHWLKWLV